MRHQSFFLAPIYALDGNGIITHTPTPIRAEQLFYKCVHTKHSLIKLPLAKIIQYMFAYDRQRISNLSS